MASLLDKYGLLKTTRVIQSFYDDVLADPLLSHYFDRVSIAELAKHQTVFLNMVLGGDKAYHPEDIEHAHRRLGLNHEEFEAMIDHLEKRLRRHGFEADDVAHIIGVYRGYEPVVTGGR